MNESLKHLLAGLLLLVGMQVLAQPTFSFSPSPTLVNQGNTFTVDVRVSNLNNVASIQFPITWNSSIITYQSISNINSTALPGLSENSFGLPGVGNAPNNQVVISWNHPSFSGVTLPSNTVLFSLTFQATTGGTTLLEFNQNLVQAIEILNPSGNSVGFMGSNGMVTVNGTGGGGNPPTPTGFTLTVGSTTAAQGSMVCLPLTASNFTNILGMQFSVNYNASQLTYTGAQTFTPLLATFGAGSVGNPSAGNLTFSWSDPAATGVTVPNGTVLVQLCFTVTGNTNATVSVTSTPTPIEIINGNEATVTASTVPGTVTVSGSNPPAPTGFTLTVGSITAAQGSMVCLPLTASNFTNILGMQFSVNYNASQLTYTGAQTFTPLLATFGAGSVGNPSAGNLTFSWSDPAATGVTIPNGTVLVELCFTVVGSTNATVSVTSTPTPIEIINGNEATVTASTVPGTVTVSGGNPPAPTGFTLTVGSTTAAQGSMVCLPLTAANFTNILGMQFSVNYNASQLTYTGAQNFTPLLATFGTGSVGNPSAGNLTFSWSDPAATGVTIPNGTVLVELCFTVAGSTNATVSVTSTPTPIEIIDGNENTVTASTVPGTVTVSGGNPPAPTGFTLTVGSTTAAQGSMVCLPLTAANFTNILGMQFSVNYNASQLTYTGAQNFTPLLATFGAGSVGNPSAGNLTFSWSDPAATGVTIPNGTVLVELCFTVVGSTNATVSVTSTPTPIEIIDGNENTVTASTVPGTVTVSGGNPPAPTGFTLTVGSATAAQGSMVCLPLTASNLTNILGMQFSVNYNASQLTYTGAQNFTPLLPTFGAGSVGNPSAGNLTFSWSDPAATGITVPNGTVLVELCFTVVGSTNATVSVTSTPTPIEIIDGDENTVTASTVPGTVTVGGVNPNPTGFTLIVGSATAAQGSMVCLPLTASNFTNILGMQFSVNYNASQLTYTGAQNFTPLLATFGAGSVGNPSAGNLTFSWSDPAATGVTIPNGTVLVELCFTVVGSTNATVSVTSTPTPIEIIDGNENPVMASTVPGTVTVGGVNPNPTGFTLTVGSATAAQGSMVCLPLTASNFTNILGMQFSVNYNASQLTYTGPQNFTPLLATFGLGSIGNPSAGNLTFSWSDPAASGVTIPNGTVLVELCFTVTGNMTSTVSVTGTPTPIEIIDGDENPVMASTVPGTVTVGTVATPVGLTIGSATATVGSQVCVPLTVQNFTGIQTMQFSINYNAAVLTYTGAQNFNAGLPAWGAASITNPSAGNLVINWTGAATTIGNGMALVDLCFNVVGTTTTMVTPSGTPQAINILNANGTVPATTTAGTITVQALPGVFAATLPTVEACTGAAFCMDVTATTFTRIRRAQFSLAYNSTNMSFAQITNLNANLPGLVPASFNTSTPGVVTFQWQNTTAVSLNPNEVLFTVCFTKLTDAASAVNINGTPLAIQIVGEDNNPVAFTGATGQVTCTPPPPFGFGQVDVVNLTCANECIGSITIVNMINGSGNYTYQWSVPGQSGNSATGLCASTVTVTVTDTANGRTVSRTLNVLSPPAIAISVTNITNILCAGASTGAITISATGGTGALTYNWSGTLPDGVTTQSNLSAGTYGVIVTDTRGCSAALNNIQVQSLNAPLLLSGTIALIPGNGMPGSINLNVTGGSPNYTYMWTGPNNYTSGAQDPNNILTPGEYCVTTTDSFGCTASTCFTMYETLRLTFFNITNACPGGNNGAIDISVAGGSCAGLTYQWSRVGGSMNFSQAQDVTGLVAGTYRVVVTDCAGTSVTADLVVNSNDAILLNATVTDVVTLTDGAISLTASGGAGGFTYRWSNNAATQNISNLTGGEYCVTVTDAAGCTQTGCFTVQSAPLVINQLQPVAVSCPGDEDGCIQLAIGGGTLPMSITITGVGNFASPNGQLEVCSLAAGEYTFTVLDAQGNTLSETFTIGEPDPLSITSFVVNDTEATGGTGIISVSISGGTGSPELNLNGVSRVGREIIVNMLTGGVYNGIIVDDNGCELPVSFAVGTVMATATQENTGCQGSADGSISVTPAGGTEPYTYSWTKAGNPAVISTESSATGLDAGTYFVVITDATGAPLSRQFTIVTQSNYTINTSLLSQPSCFNTSDGRVQANVANTGASTQFFYEWEFNEEVVGTAAQLTTAGAGTYTVYVVDNFMCETTATVEVTAPAPVVLNGTVQGISCGDKTDGAIVVVASGGTGNGYVFNWSANNAVGPQLVNLPAGNYTVTVSDANACTQTASYTVAPATLMNVSVVSEPHTDPGQCNGTVNAIVTGGTAPYNYNWMNIPNSPNSAVVTDLCFGTYFVVVTDARGCVAEQAFGVVDNEQFDCFEERLVITPDGNGSNDEFIIFCLTDTYNENHLEIFNRWGQLVFQADNYDNTWEGTAQNGEDLPAGPYFWVLDYTGNNGEQAQRRGSLTIVRK